MTYLQLCQRLREECGIQGTGTPTTVLSQVGILFDVTKWIAQAWVDIQISRPNWNFMWSEFTFDTDDVNRDYVAADQAITNMAYWDTGSFLIHLTSAGTSDQNILPYTSYANWRRDYRNRMTDRPSDRPQLVTALPNKTLRFEPRPDAIYTIEGDYKTTAQNFTANSDVPTGLDDDLHMIIVWLALTKYAYKKAAPEKLELAEIEYNTLLFRLEASELPAFSENYKALA